MRLSTAAIFALVLVAGCTTTQKAPVMEGRPSLPGAKRPPPAPSVAVPAPSAAVRPPLAASTDVRPETYVVRRGDTLYSIALDHGLDHRELADWNNLSDPNAIRSGQVLRLRAPESAVQVQPLVSAAPIEARPLESRPLDTRAEPSRAPAPSAPQTSAPALVGPLAKSEPRAVKLPYSEANLAALSRSEPRPAPVQPGPEARPEPKPAPKIEPPAAGAGVDGEKLDWGWPAPGRVLAGFSEPSNKGLDITGNVGDPVYAAASGVVRYVGTGIPGWGKLVIIRHNGNYISAYAHNREVLVKELQTVVKGQKIAELGDLGADRPKLHFEIRRQGKPVDPMKLLPDRPS